MADTCASCGQTIGPNERFCPACGGPVEAAPEIQRPRPLAPGSAKHSKSSPLIILFGVMGAVGAFAALAVVLTRGSLESQGGSVDVSVSSAPE